MRRVVQVSRARSLWGWGHEDDAVPVEERDRLAGLIAALLGIEVPQAREAVRLEDLALPAPRVTPPAALAPLLTDDRRERAAHAAGKSFRDTVRAFRGELTAFPDLVAVPGDENDISALLDWCTAARIAVIPFGGGSSVVGGVEPLVGDAFAGCVSLDLRRLDRLLELDAQSRAARFEAGILGPALEDALRPHGLTLRHYPQSFEFSSLGGWLATRSGGHFATLHTHIDDFVESIRALTPRGVTESRRLPASGAGPSPDRLLLGSEGSLAVITSAWMRVQERPRFRAASPVAFGSFEAALAAARALGQSGLYPSNCRVLDATEAMVSGTGDGSAHLLLLAFESADHPVDAALLRGLELCRDHGGAPLCDAAPPSRSAGTPAADGDAVGAWRSSFLRAPYLRDALVSLGLISETFETAVTWDRVDALCASVQAAVRGSASWRGGVVSTRVTHVYPDGCAPYFTVIAASEHGNQVAQWDELKHVAAEAVLAGGGTITHHHAVGRDHMPQYLQQRPALFGDALAAAKRALDPAGILNPGVLVPL